VIVRTASTMPVFVKGAWVWYESPEDSWLPLRMMSNQNGKVVKPNKTTTNSFLLQVCKSQTEEEFALNENLVLIVRYN